MYGMFFMCFWVVPLCSVIVPRNLKKPKNFFLNLGFLSLGILQFLSIACHMQKMHYRPRNHAGTHQVSLFNVLRLRASTCAEMSHSHKLVKTLIYYV